MLTMINSEALLQFAKSVKTTGYNFITITPATHERVNARLENSWARSLTDVLGWSRPFQFQSTVINEELFSLMREAHVLCEVKTENERGWKSLLRMSSLDGELFLHSAYPTLAADSVFFGPETYRLARSIRATLTTRDIVAHPIHRAVDIGCGAGPNAILLAKACPDAEVLAVDINEVALQLTAINAKVANVNVVPTKSDLLNDVEGAFDMIVSNPPYLVDVSMRSYRHGGGPLGAGLSIAIVRTACQRLAPDGTLLLYTASAIVNGHDLFLDEAKKILDNAALMWSYEEIDPDVFGEELDTPFYAHVDRIAAVVLTATKK